MSSFEHDPSGITMRERFANFVDTAHLIANDVRDGNMDLATLGAIVGIGGVAVGGVQSAKAETPVGPTGETALIDPANIDRHYSVSELVTRLTPPVMDEVVKNQKLDGDLFGEVGDSGAIRAETDQFRVCTDKTDPLAQASVNHVTRPGHFEGNNAGYYNRSKGVFTTRLEAREDTICAMYREKRVIVTQEVARNGKNFVENEKVIPVVIDNIPTGVELSKKNKGSWKLYKIRQKTGNICIDATRNSRVRSTLTAVSYNFDGTVTTAVTKTQPQKLYKRGKNKLTKSPTCKSNPKQR